MQLNAASSGCPGGFHQSHFDMIVFPAQSFEDEIVGCLDK
jgi:hypothetical protein